MEQRIHRIIVFLLVYSHYLHSLSTLIRFSMQKQHVLGSVVFSSIFVFRHHNGTVNKYWLGIKTYSNEQIIPILFFTGHSGTF